MASSRRLPGASLMMLAMSVLYMSCAVMRGAEANCTVQNKSSKPCVVQPVDVNVSIEVDIGVTVEVPPTEQNCYFTNAETGHKLGPVKLNDGTLVVIVDGSVSGTVDVYEATVILGILHLGINICISL